MNLRIPLIPGLILSLSACEIGDDGIRYSFKIWECSLDENVAAIEQSARKAARGLDMEMTVGTITQGGSGPTFSLGKGGFEITLWVMEDKEIVKVYATHADEPSEDDRAIAANVFASLPLANCRELESYADLQRREAASKPFWSALWSKIVKLGDSAP